jgi:hypothetical protein
MRGVTKDDRSVYLRNVEWTSDNELVATVTNGKVKGLAAGTCTVTATYGGTLSASCEVTVIEVTKEMVVITDNIYVVANDYAYSTDYGDYMYGKHVSPRIAYDPDGNKCIVVSTRKGPENAYDEQLFIVSKGELRQGDALTLSFRVRGLYSQNSQTEAHYAPGKFLYMYPTSEVRVTNEWTQYSYEFTVGENVRTIAIDLSRLETGNDLFFDNISLISSNYGTAVFPDNIVSDGTERSHEYVDLGLSVNWATTNLGSESVDGVGGKYRWEDNSVDWGGEWRLPTKYEMEELKNNCTWFWTERNGVWGYLISSEIEGYKDRKLFLPAAHQDKDTAVGRYWTDSKESTRAWNMDFRMDSLSVAMKKNSISEELSIRPVLMSQSWVENLKVVGSAYNTVLVNGHCAVNVYVVVNGQVVDYPVTYTSDNNQIATVDENGVVTGISPGTTTITAECHGKTSTCTIKVVNEEHEFVDMGLSVKWATVNVGATEPEDYGYYFAWGEIDHEGPFDYTDYKWGTGTNSITKYNRMDGLKNLSASDDAASFVWGEDVHTPTEDEWIELIENCEWEWDRLNGINGYTVTAVNGNSIFLPAAGRMYKSDSSGDGSGGRYWSNSVSSSSYSSARGLYFSSSEHYVGSYGREYGFSVRPVCP